MSFNATLVSSRFGFGFGYNGDNSWGSRWIQAVGGGGSVWVLCLGAAMQMFRVPGGYRGWGLQVGFGRWWSLPIFGVP